MSVSVYVNLLIHSYQLLYQCSQSIGNTIPFKKYLLGQLKFTVSAIFITKNPAFCEFVCEIPTN